MRRTMALVLGVCGALALGGTTAVEALHLTPVRTSAETALPPAAAAPANRPAAIRPAENAQAKTDADRPVNPAETVWQTGAEEAGKVEAARTTLGYLDGRNAATFRYPGVDYVKVHFTRLSLLPGDYLTIARPDGTESQRYDGTLLDGLGDTVGGLLGESAGKWAMSVTGDTAVVKLHLGPTDLLGLRGSLAEMGVTVDKVARGFTKPERDAQHDADQQRKKEAARTGREESICGSDDKFDAVCYRTTDPVMYRRSKAVARLLINGTELCTAWRVGPDNRMITNHHCFTTSQQAAETEVWFNYQCAVCGGYDVFRPTKVWGSQVLATDQRLDYTLFTLDDFAAVRQYGYLDLDVRAPQAGEKVYIPQNPAGDPTMIAADSDQDGNGNCEIVNPSYDGYDKGTDASYYCDTAGGSSGSPVISRVTNKVIALHHFGGCPNSGVRVDELYPAIRSLL